MAFWKKIFKSKYTGAEIDAAVAKAGNLPATTSADAGKALVVDDEGKIVAGEAGGGSAEYIDAYVTGNETLIKYTIAEIKAMVEAGKTVILRLTSDGVTTIFDLGLILSNQVVFSQVGMDDEFIVFQSLVFQDLTKPADDYKAHVVNNYMYEMEYSANT